MDTTENKCTETQLILVHFLQVGNDIIFHSLDILMKNAIS